MPIAVVENKIRQLPETYLLLVNNFVDSLLEKATAIKSLQGSLSRNASPELREKEKDAWLTAATEKHTNEFI